jgi:hypothetical protein
MDKIHRIIRRYLRFVILWDLDEDGNNWCDKTDDITEYLDKDFRSSALYTFDIVSGYEGDGDYAGDGHYKCGRQGSVSEIMDADTICRAIQIIETDEPMDYRYITPGMVLCNYMRVYIHSMSTDELVNLILM